MLYQKLLKFYILNYLHRKKPNPVKHRNLFKAFKKTKFFKVQKPIGLKLKHKFVIKDIIC